jgi:hypothetical protein
VTGAAQVLAEAAEALGDLSVPDRTVAVPVDDAFARRDEAELRFFLYAGLFALLAEADREESGDERAAADLDRALRVIRSAEPGVRFARFERRDATERRELVARMRGREIAVTREWLLPRLRSDIDAYRARIAALRDAIARTGNGAR